MKNSLKFIITIATVLGICGSAHSLINNAGKKSITATETAANGTESVR